MSNPGPATNGIANSMLATAPVNTQVNPTPILTGAKRLLAVGRSVNANAIGDTQLGIINAGRWVVSDVVCTNASSASVTNCNIIVNAAAANGGTTIVSSAALSSLNSTTYAKYMTVTATNTVQTGSNIYVYVTTTAGATATFDIFILGFDLS